MIQGIEIKDCKDNIYYNENNFKLNYIYGVNKINIFVGENNSGKSRLMRTLIKDESVRMLSIEYVAMKQKKILDDYKRTIKSSINSFNSYSNGELKVEDEIYELDYLDFIEKINNIIESQITEKDEEKFEHNKKFNLNNLKSELARMTDYLSKKDLYGHNKSILSTSPIYIPILRGIENYNIYFNIDSSQNDINSIALNQKQRNALDGYKNNVKHIYKNKIQKAYGISKDNIFTAENLYEEIIDKLLGEEKGRSFIKEFQEFISEQFYNGKEFTIIPQRKYGYLHVKIDSQEKELYNLGDGIKQIITILYKIFEYRNEEKIFFIEEPELNLHPGFQRKIIEIFQLPIFEKHQYFITTHSNHLIDSCFDYKNISIYKFINIDNSNSRFKVLRTTSNDVDLLQILGVNNSSVFMSNCTIWVEGISDKILLKKYLDMYFEKHNIKNLKEDINFSFVEYGGNNIKHWAFIPDEDIETINARGITNRCFFICDNDNDSEKKRVIKRKLKSVFNDNYYELTVREIENTISKNVLERTLFGDKDVEYKKTFKEKDYMNKSTYMGNFIDTHYKLSRKYSASRGSGTIVDKAKFAKNIVDNIFSFDDLSIQAKNISRKIVDFIQKSNNN